MAWFGRRFTRYPDARWLTFACAPLIGTTPMMDVSSPTVTQNVPRQASDNNAHGNARSRTPVPVARAARTC